MQNESGKEQSDNPQKQKWQSRTRLAIGDDGVDKLQQAHVLIIGTGGVGSFVAEFLGRAGVGSFTLVDKDTISFSNINRQLPALHSTVQMSKVAVVKNRLIDINPSARVTALEIMFDYDSVDSIFSHGPFTAVVDCIDTLFAKALLVESVLKKELPLFSSMGAGGKIDVSQVKTGMFWQIKGDKLAYHLRSRLRKLGVDTDFTAVYSAEPVDKNRVLNQPADGKASVSGTVSYLPAAFGGHLSQAVIQFVLESE